MVKRLRYLGLVEEETYNDPSPPIAVQHVDIASATLDTPTDTELVYVGGLGRAPRTRRPGYYSPSGNFVYAFDIKTIGWLLKWALGGYEYTAGVLGAQNEVQQLYLGGATGGTFVLGNGVDITPPLSFDVTYDLIDDALTELYGEGKVNVADDSDFNVTFFNPLEMLNPSGLIAYFGGLTGATNPSLTLTTPYISEKNLHELYGTHNTELPSFVARLGKDNLDDTDFEHVISGCIISQLVIEVSDGFAMATADIIGAKDSKDTIQAIEDLILPDKYPLTFTNLAVEIGEVDKSTLIKSTTLTINNNADAAAGRSVGSRHSRRGLVGARDVSFSMDLYYETIDELKRLWGSETGPNADGATEFPIALILDAGNDGELRVDIPKAWYTAVPIQPSGRDEIVPTLAGKALVDTITLADTVTEVDTEILISLENDEAEMVVAD